MRLLVSLHRLKDVGTTSAVVSSMSKVRIIIMITILGSRVIESGVKCKSLAIKSV